MREKERRIVKVKLSKRLTWAGNVRPQIKLQDLILDPLHIVAVVTLPRPEPNSCLPMFLTMHRRASGLLMGSFSKSRRSTCVSAYRKSYHCRWNMDELYGEFGLMKVTAA